MIFFLVENFGYAWVRMQKYPKSTSTQKVFGTDMASFFKYFIANNWC